MTYRLEKMGQRKYSGLTVLNPKGDRHFNGVVKCHNIELVKPFSWRKPRRIFVNSMSDTFHKDVPFEFVDKIFAVMALNPQHTFQVLTKRPDRMAEYLSRNRCDFVWDEAMRRTSDVVSGDWPLPNVWLGTSCEDQQRADERIPHLLKCPAAIRFLSLEPLLGPITLPTDNLRGYSVHEAHAYHCEANHGGECDHKNCPVPEQEQEPSIDWIIVGGESGGEARPCAVEWVRDIVKQCAAASVPCFVKQMGKSLDMRFDEWVNDWMLLTDAKKFTLHKPGANRGIWCGVDHKGGDMSEWPADLKVRQFPDTKLVEAKL
jgi:protein gp37